MRKMLSQKKCPADFFLVFVCATLLGSGCNQKTASSSSSDADYQLDKPVVTPLGNVLKEISGICYYNKNGDSALLAIVDSKEQVFKLDMKIPQLVDYTNKVILAKDPEDVVMVDSSIYVLLSNGEINELPDKAKDTMGLKSYVLPLPGKNDFETIYYDPLAKGLIMLCKSCEHEKKAGIRTSYRFDLATKTFDTSEYYIIEKDAVKEMLQDANAKFDPSAAAIHPINKRLYILSSAGNLLVVTDTKGTVMEAYKLSPYDFPQAEGIAFAPNGDMYISNEGKNGAVPTLLYFPYRQQSTTKKQQ